jgi:hypothetical protein
MWFRVYYSSVVDIFACNFLSLLDDDHHGPIDLNYVSYANIRYNRFKYLGTNTSIQAVDISESVERVDANNNTFIGFDDGVTLQGNSNLFISKTYFYNVTNCIKLEEKNISLQDRFGGKTIEFDGSCDYYVKDSETMSTAGSRYVNMAAHDTLALGSLNNITNRADGVNNIQNDYYFAITKKPSQVNIDSTLQTKEYIVGDKETDNSYSIASEFEDGTDYNSDGDTNDLVILRREAGTWTYKSALSDN